MGHGRPNLGSMRLLGLSCDDDAQTRVATARKMVDETGYHRRDKDIVEIERQLEDKP